MKVIIKHRSRGRIRVQMAQPRMTLEQADLLECYLQRLPQVIRASVHERTRCAIVEYQGSQAEILRAFSQFSYQMDGLHPPVSSSRALNRTYEEKLVGMAAAKAVSVLFFPAPLRIAYTVWKAIPHLLRGLRCLLRGQMVVEVLDALSIGISLLRGDFATASSVRFLLGLGELLEEWSHKKSVSDLAQCMSLNIDQVWLRTPQGEVLMPLSQIQTGDQVCVRLGGLIPLDGVITIETERAKGHMVIMIGDGVNDSPALSKADVGIAISDGAAIAREIADITIAADDLHELVSLRRIAGKLTVRIRSNYRFVMGFNGSLIALGAFGVLPPATSAMLHNLSTLGVSLRSMTNLLEPS